VEDDPRDGVAAFVVVQSDARGAAELFIVDPAQQVQRLGDAAEFGDRASEPAGPAAALEDAQELGRTDGPSR